MNINILAVLAATVAQFIVSAIWYMPIFGALWGRMHGFDKVPPEQQKEMQKTMLPWLGLQFVLTLTTSFVFDLLLGGLPPEWNTYGLAFFFWLGFTMPAQAGLVIFGGTPKEWVFKKIAVASGASLVSFLTAAFVFNLLG